MAFNKDICFVCGDKLYKYFWADTFSCDKIYDNKYYHQYRWRGNNYIDVYYKNITINCRPSIPNEAYVLDSFREPFRSNDSIIIIKQNILMLLKTEDKILEHIRNIQLMS